MAMEVDKDKALTPVAASSYASQIQTLVELSEKVQALRQYPAQLLRTPTSGGLVNDLGGSVDLESVGLSLSRPEQIRRYFGDLKQFVELVKSENVQAALKAAQQSGESQKGPFGVDVRKEQRQFRRGPSPDAPSPFPAFNQRPATWPLASGELPPLYAHEVAGFVREFNAHRTERVLRIWALSRSHRVSATGPPNPLILRFEIPDILTTFIRFERHADDQPLVIENVTAFGPREKTLPHSQSEYTVYLKLSQEFAKVLQKHPQLHLQHLLELLQAYDGLFTDKCPVCDRVLSLEGHLPPIARAWMGCSISSSADEGNNSNWEPRHTACLES
ncbi:hypothetical protein PUNSTDRAFT_124862 [Punctularia strigosozonata HHB-11173 SS5]|uniref:uncharacterized protein n=1 Tax=Punctularia strigosozonata (strain HHB-11173) TaxID=741275 RepID=UPI0004417643|nr:uncharacterized protein PUNSTDRAFT_124862 [Punctularia strigosozonata HHB-11173 SS5]EIN11570.1 hypothetical protein PUNSTDRAFT_124862 [Punctularia strigosozonata HHB-11173 SS5]